MAELDRRIEHEISALQLRGASTAEIADRYAALNSWAMQECADAAKRMASQITSEAHVAQRLWAQIEPEVNAAFASGRVDTITCFELLLCETGDHVILLAESDADLDLHFYAGEDFYPHFNPLAWEDALSPTAAIYGADLYIFDCHRDRLFDMSSSEWSRVF